MSSTVIRIKFKTNPKNGLVKYVSLYSKKVLSFLSINVCLLSKKIEVFVMIFFLLPFISFGMAYRTKKKRNWLTN